MENIMIVKETKYQKVNMKNHVQRQQLKNTIVR